jgi:pimeloyl-ACP methyl ester carboxylesterase
MTAPTALFLAGHMCDSRLWPAPVRQAAGVYVDADLTQDASVEAMASRALACVNGKLLPIGFSMGGIVALAMGSIAPERIAGMVLLDTNPHADLPERAVVRPRQQAQVRAGALEAVVVNELKPNYLARSNSTNQALRDLLWDMANVLGDQVFLRQSEALRTRPDRTHVLGRLEVPMLIACGEEDRLCPPDWHRSMAQHASQATLRIIADAGHMLPLEQPARLADELSQWRSRFFRHG